jgi:hypothetical protein
MMNSHGVMDKAQKVHLVVTLLDISPGYPSAIIKAAADDNLMIKPRDTDLGKASTATSSITSKGTVRSQSAYL